MIDVTERMTDEQKRIYRKHINNRPVNVIELIKDLGIMATTAGLPSWATGAIRKEGNKFKIYVEKDLSADAKWFALSYGIGLYFFCRDSMEDSGIIYSNEPSQDDLCRDAFTFAIELVMRNHRSILLHDDKDEFEAIEQSLNDLIERIESLKKLLKNKKG